MLILLVILTFFASIFSTVIGFGSAVILIPIFALVLPIKNAIAILSIYFIFVTVMRAFLFWKNIDWHIVALISIGSIPAVFIGLSVMLQIDANVVKILLAVVILIYLINDYFNFDNKIGKISHKWSIIIGFFYGFFNGIIGTGNPITAAFLIHIGLRKENFIANMATCSIMLDIIKSIVLSSKSFVTMEDIFFLTSIVIVGMIGTYFGKQIVGKLNAKYFKKIVTGMLFIVSFNLIWQAM